MQHPVHHLTNVVILLWILSRIFIVLSCIVHITFIKTMSALHAIVDSLPSGPEHAALQMLVELNDVHNHEVASLDSKVQALETDVAAMSTPETVASRGAAKALEQAVDFAFPLRLHVDNHLEIYIIYRNTDSNMTGEYKINFHNDSSLIGQWTQVNLWPFSVPGDMSLDNADDYPRLVHWTDLDQFKSKALSLLQSGFNGWHIASVYFINSANGLVQVYGKE
jgi:hypothetical protein